MGILSLSGKGGNSGLRSPEIDLHTINDNYRVFQRKVCTLGKPKIWALRIQKLLTYTYRASKFGSKEYSRELLAAKV